MKGANLLTRIFIFSLASFLALTESAMAHNDVTVEVAKNMIANNPQLIVVDIREPYEYCSVTGHIPGAYNYPWTSGVLESNYADFPLDSQIMLYCNSGNRSNQAATFLDSLGFIYVYDMLGGIRAWDGEVTYCYNTALYFPSIYDGVDGWKNYISVQAQNPADTVHILVKYYNPDGTLATPDTTLCPTCVNPESFTILPYMKYNTTPNYALYGTLQNTLYEGTVVVEADKPVIGLTNALGPLMEAFNIYEAAKPQTELFFSKVFDGKVTTTGRSLEWVNNLQIMNVEDFSVSVTITVNNADGSLNGQLIDQVIPAHGKLDVRPSAITGISPTSGTITVSVSGGKVAGMIKYQYGTGMESESFTIYEGNMAKTLSYLPKMYDGFGGNNNYISVLNANSAPVTVDINLYDDAGLLLHNLSSLVNPNISINSTPSYMMCGALGCTNFSGSVEISATAPVYTTTNTVSPSMQDLREAFNIYEATAPATTLLFPKLYDGFNNWINDVSIKNADPTAAHDLSISFYDGSGVHLKSVVQSIPALGQYNFSPRTLMGAPFNNTMIITSDAPDSITGVVRYEFIDPVNTNIRNLTIYEAIAQ